MRTTKKVKRISTSANQMSEADVDICNVQKNKKTINGCRHPQLKHLKRMSTSVIPKKITKQMSTSATQLFEPQLNCLKRMSTSVIPKKQKKLRNGCRHLQLNCLKRMSTSLIPKKQKQITKQMSTSAT